MAWKKVTVKEGNKGITAFMQKDSLEMPNVYKDKPTSVMVEGKSFKVLSAFVDKRDNIIKIKLELPMGSPKKLGESDDKSNESTG